MKKLITTLLAGVGIGLLSSPLFAQEFKEHIVKEFDLSGSVNGNTLLIYNLDGFIKVEGYNGNKVLMEIDKVISADDTATLEQGKKEFKLGIDQRGDSTTVYIAQPWDSRPHHRYNIDWDDRERIEYRYSLQFTVKVPFNMNLVVSTVNNGYVTIKDVAGNLKANNVNGPITIENAKGTTTAATINGGVRVNYLSNPPGPSTFKTLNGDINVTFQPDLAADLQFKSWHGGYYTDFPHFEVLPAIVAKNEEKKGGTTTYKIDRTTAVRIGAGGRLLKFETMNGSVYIKKQS